MRAIPIYILLSLLLSCSSGSGIQSDDLSDGWHYDEPVQLDISALPSPRSLQITHSDSYGYQNIYLTLTGDNDYRDTISVRLASKDGYWLGERSGSSYTVGHELPELSDLSQITITQHSRDSLLLGILQIGVLCD